MAIRTILDITTAAVGGQDWTSVLKHGEVISFKSSPAIPKIRKDNQTQKKPSGLA